MLCVILIEMEMDSLELSDNEGSEGLTSVLSWDKWDNQTDSLPMMTTIAWPLGKHLTE